jgi:hypothetical protein
LTVAINVEKNPEGGGGVVAHVKIRPPTYKGACREQLAKRMSKRQKTTHARDPIWGVWPIGSGILGHVAVLESATDANVFYTVQFHKTTLHLDERTEVKTIQKGGPEPVKAWLFQELVSKRDMVHRSINYFEWLVGMALFDTEPTVFDKTALFRLFREVLPNCRMPEQWAWEGSRLERATQIMATTDESVEDAVGHLFGRYGHARKPEEGGVVTIPRLTDLIRAQHSRLRDWTLATDEHDRSKADWIAPTMHPPNLRVSVPPYHEWHFSLIDPGTMLVSVVDGDSHSIFDPPIVISTNAARTLVEDFEMVASFRGNEWKTWRFTLNGSYDDVDPSMTWAVQPGFNDRLGAQQTLRCYRIEE